MNAILGMKGVECEEKASANIGNVLFRKRVARRDDLCERPTVHVLDDDLCVTREGDANIDVLLPPETLVDGENAGMVTLTL